MCDIETAKSRVRESVQFSDRLALPLGCRTMPRLALIRRAIHVAGALRVRVFIARLRARRMHRKLTAACVHTVVLDVRQRPNAANKRVNIVENGGLEYTSTVH